MADDGPQPANQADQAQDSTDTAAPLDSTQVSQPNVTPQASKSNRNRFVLIGLLILLVIIGGPYGWRWWQYYSTHESTDDAYVTGSIIPISARVPGAVISVLVKDHQQVEVGQLLARLDRRDFETKLQQAQAFVNVAAARLRQAEIEVTQEQGSTSSDTARTNATLRAAQSSLAETQHVIVEAQAVLRTLETAVTVAQAELDAQDAHLAMARTALQRSTQLLKDGVVSQQLYDEANIAMQSTEAERRVAAQKLSQAQREVERARADLRTKRQMVERAQAGRDEAVALLAGSQARERNVDIKQAQVEVVRAQLQQRQADLAFAKLQLDYTDIRAPSAGVIAKQNLEVGQVIQPGRPVMAIVPLGIEHIWVEANFKETQLHRMRPGQSASLKIDAYPGEAFQGTVESISPGTGSVFSLLPPENATGNFVKVVQRVPVRIVLDRASPNESVLRPGMSVIATVATHSPSR